MGEEIICLFAPHTLLDSGMSTIALHRFCIAPMMEWTDRHCRFFHRLLTRRALLYTEMVTTGAVIRGDRARLIGFDPDRKSTRLNSSHRL